MTLEDIRQKYDDSVAGGMTAEEAEAEVSRWLINYYETSEGRMEIQESPHFQMKAIPVLVATALETVKEPDR